MSTPIDTGGPAFPQAPQRWVDIHGVQHVSQSCGMSLRDYFAAKALPGAILEAQELFRDDDGDGSVNRFDWCARRAYHYADAMLAAWAGKR